MPPATGLWEGLEHEPTGDSRILLVYDLHVNVNADALVAGFRSVGAPLCVGAFVLVDRAGISLGFARVLFASAQDAVLAYRAWHRAQMRFPCTCVVVRNYSHWVDAHHGVVYRSDAEFEMVYSAVLDARSED